MKNPFSDVLRNQAWYMRLRFKARSLIWKHRGTYEEREFYLLPWLVDPRRAAIDVGAHYGGYAGRLAQLASAVHCFEPDPGMAAQLRLRLPGSITVYQAAASNRSGTAEFFMPVRADGSQAGEVATLEQNNPVIRSRDVRKSVVEVVRLDDVIRDPVGFIKIDVEGHEMSVLEGAEGLIRAHRPVVLIETARLHNPASPLDVFAFFAAHGYDGLFLHQGLLTPLAAFREELHHKLRPDGRPDPRYVFNFIFLPREPALA